MAPRYLARRVGMPALRQASGSRVTPSAGCGPLASRSSQAAYSNGGGASQKQRSELMDQIMAMMREDKMFLLGLSAVIGGYFYATYSEVVVIWQEINAQVLREKAYNKAVAAAREEASSIWQEINAQVLREKAYNKAVAAAREEASRVKGTWV